ncbi:hypothetical protein [Dechloromonas hortensis]|uniref:hypothetical protein n=1 Tax=Dechloromonas hortensis TaxID=337779 RepID=UPI001290C5EA|nr:hypothetical protein [Dechloromonas hortensis]
MNKLITQLQRLYFLPDQPGLCQSPEDDGSKQPFQPVSADGTVRTLSIRFARPGDWEALARLYQALQEELDLPAPAISVSGDQGFRLWLSLAQPVPVGLARHFLAELRRRYLADLPPASLELVPGAESATINLVPALNAATGKWSAFIDPSLGSMFSDESGLEMAPNMDRQADLLASLKSIDAAAFRHGLALLAADEPSPAPDDSTQRPADKPSTLSVGSNYSDPKSFLLAVMNDPSASAGQRIKAAKALLPYFAGKRD